MAHKITQRAQFLEVEHFGAVSYTDRLAALDAVAEASSLSGPVPLLINLTEAFLTDDLQRDNRVYYMAKVICHKFFDGRKVAMAGVTQAQAGPAMIAGAVRETEFRVFEDRESAVQWLTQPVRHRAQR